MSPSEADLRAALRHGEGDGVDADRVLIAASRRRERRRTRLLSVAGAVVVVGGIAGGLAAIANGGDNGEESASKAGGANSSMHSSAAFGPAAGAARMPAANASCPAVFPHFMHPGARGPATDGPLFSQPISTIIVCGYGTPGTKPGRAVFTGQDATDLTQSLERTPTLPSPGNCLPGLTKYRFAMIGLATGGLSAGTVTAVFDCEVTNGTAVRIGWQPPEHLRGVLTRLVQDGAPSGTKHASPIRS